MRKKIIFLIFTIIFIAPPVFATESSSSANMSAELKVKLDEMKKEIASKAAKLKQEVNLKLQNKAFIGTLKSKTDTSLVLDSDTGTKNVTINQDTAYKSPLKKLVAGDYIACLGDVDDNGVLTAKKIILQSPPKASSTFLWGQIISIADKLITIQTRDLRKIAVAPASLKDLNIRDFIILTGILNKNNIFQADFIHIIPQGGIIKPKKVATPSAKIASPSAKPKTTSR